MVGASTQPRVPPLRMPSSPCNLNPVGRVVVHGNHWADIHAGGSITLASSSPFDDPFIDFAFFESRLDLLTVIEGIRSVHHFYTSSKAFEGYNLSLVPDFPSLDDDAALEAYIRNTADHAAHPVGTAAMTARDADWGVVDPDLRLKKAGGLRVVDASVMVST